MRKIASYVAQIADELDGAKCYAEDYLEKKAIGNSQAASMYREMANDELKHASYIHDIAVTDIEQLRSVYTPPVDMEKKWEESHREYVEKAAWIKTMLAM